MREAITPPATLPHRCLQRLRSRHAAHLAAALIGLACSTQALALRLDLGPAWVDFDPALNTGFESADYRAEAGRLVIAPGPGLGIGEAAGGASIEFALTLRFEAKPGVTITALQLSANGTAGQGPYSAAWLAGDLAGVAVANRYSASNSYTGEASAGSPEAWQITLPASSGPVLAFNGQLGVGGWPSTVSEVVGTHQDVIGWDPVYDTVQVQVGTEPLFDWVRVCHEGVIGHTESGELVYGTVCDNQWLQVGEQPVYEWQQVQVGQNPIYGEVPTMADVTRASLANVAIDRVQVQVTAVPEPQSALLMILGVAGLAWRLRRPPGWSVG